MTDKNNPKFPYIVCPSLSQDADSPPSTPDATTLTNENQSAQTTPRTKTSKLSRNTQLPSLNVNVNVQGCPPQPLSSTGISRHISLSKQLGKPSASSPQPKPISNSNKMRQELFNMAQYEMRQSPRTLYPSEDEIRRNQQEATRYDQRLLTQQQQSQSFHGDEEISPKLNFEALSQIFPHRTRQQLKSSRKQSASATSLQTILESPNVKSSRKTNSQSMKAVLEKVVSAQSSSSSVSTIESKSEVDLLKTRLNGLTVHMKHRDEEISKLKEHVIDLQLLILKEKKDTESTNKMMERLSQEMGNLERKLDALEKSLETNILNKLLLIDEMASSDSESSEYGRLDAKPSNWMLSSRSSSNTSNPNPVKSLSSNISTPTTPSASASGISSLKECVNWIPIAPDFDKLLNVIALLNFRMDRNQSMKLSRNGNEAQFKHADTTQLTIYKNGLVLGNTGFRSYATLSVIKMINEMFGGYFPTELHPQFPDGVIFVVTDKRSVVYEQFPGFNGVGTRLLLDSKSVPILLPNPECLALPRRASEMSVQTNHSNLNNQTASNIELASFYIALPDMNTYKKNGHKIISLKLRNVLNGKSYKLRLCTSTTINEISNHVEKHIPTTDQSPNPQEPAKDFGKPTKFDIILPLPHGILKSTSSTLKDYGLVTNVLLYIKPREETTIEAGDNTVS